MLIKNNEYTINITRLGSEGQGIGEIDGLVVFVEDSLPGDEIKVKIIKVKKSYAIGKLLNIISPSKNRVKAKCSVFSKCGGCNLQNYEYEEQLIYKKDKVYNNLKRISGIETDVKDVIGMEEPYFYRNKAQYPVQKNKNGGIDIGFYRKRSHNIIPINDCVIQHKSFKKVIDIVYNFMKENKIEPYDEETGKGIIRHIVTRISFFNNDIMVCLVINNDKLPFEEKLIKELRKIEEVKSIYLNINKDKTNVIMSRKLILLWGEKYIVDKIGSIYYGISPLSFFQVNPAQTEILYNTIVDFADFSSNEVVLDAYCGAGAISLFISKYVKKVVGIEIVKDAIEDAKKNVKLNNISNVEFFVGAVEELMQEKMKVFNFDTLIVDPPRKGCEIEFLNSILKVKPNKIIYVSCDPSTLSRDLKILCENDYKVKRVQPVDCFCQTYHVETVVLLEHVN